jgi:hypothetical protein
MLILLRLNTSSRMLLLRLTLARLTRLRRRRIPPRALLLRACPVCPTKPVRLDLLSISTTLAPVKKYVYTLSTLVLKLAISSLKAVQPSLLTSLVTARTLIVIATELTTLVLLALRATVLPRRPSSTLSRFLMPAVR